MRPHFSRASLLALLLVPALSAQENSFIQSLQLRGTGRRVELETRAGQSFDRARLERDVRRLWATGWFDDIRVEANQTPEGVALIFAVVERPRLYLRRFRFQPPSEKYSLGLQPGTPVDKAWAHRLAGALRQRLVGEGYAHAAVAAELVPAGVKQVDLLLRIQRGPRYTVRAVHFAGELGLPRKDLQGALPATRSRRLLPFWRLPPPWSEARILSDLDRLRSLYLARGYFDARVSLAGIAFADTAATLTIEVNSGPRYRVEQLALVQSDTRTPLRIARDGILPIRELCSCLLDAQRNAERAGKLDFSAQLEIAAPARLPQASPQTGPGVALTARTQSGPALSVGRIEFRGHHAFSDLTLRRALTLDEGDTLDLTRLRQSLARLNRLGFFEPLAEDNVELHPAADPQRVDLTFHLQQRPRGRWTLAGPLGPFAVAGPLQFAIGTRLPAWGRGAFELSTYSATFSLLAFSQPIIRALALVPERRWLPLVTLERPYLPGQEWRSGFFLSPPSGWRGTLTSYALSHARHALHRVLEPQYDGPASLPLSVWWRARHDYFGGRAAGKRSEPALQPAGVLLCEAEKSRWAWLRTAGATALDFLLLTRPL